jgi:GTPase SAR1 family protein
MNTIEDIEQLIADINDQISNAENISDKKGYQYVAWCDFLKSIKAKLENAKYKFVFIGQKGIGKTTTILELFGLNKTINGKHEDLLTTAAGGTTTCEVELLKSDKTNTYFEIEPIDANLFNQYIDDFCAMYDDAENLGDDSYLPSEINRSIRNMIGLKKKDIEIIRKSCKDIAIFKLEVLKRINSESRTQTVIDCNINDGTYFKDCQKLFNEINVTVKTTASRQIERI